MTSERKQVSRSPEKLTPTVSQAKKTGRPGRSVPLEARHRANIQLADEFLLRVRRDSFPTEGNLKSPPQTQGRI